jgi:hypothetical protein
MPFARVGVMPQPNQDGQSNMNQKVANPSSGRQKGITMEVSLCFPMASMIGDDGVSIIHAGMTVTEKPGFLRPNQGFLGNSRVFLSK